MYVNVGTATFTNCEIFENTADGPVCLCPAPFHGPHGSSSRKRPSRSQGGGVYVYGAVVNFDGCNIYSNTAGYVRLCPAPFHGPNGSRFQEVSLAARIGWWRVRLRNELGG